MRAALVAVMLLLCPTVSVRAHAGDNKETGGIDSKVVEAWKKAGAQVGWLAHDVAESSPLFTPERPKNPQAVQAFRLVDAMTLQKVKDLPAPAVPFGLDFSSVMATDADMKAIAGFTKLHTLDLFSTTITDDGLKELAKLEHLHALYLDNTKIGDVGMKALAGMKTLRTLNLFNTPITDVGMKELAGLKQLQWLDLGSTKITDTGLMELANLKRLEILKVDGTMVKDAGVAELQKALPKCKIDR
jgi:internalin A